MLENLLKEWGDAWVWTSFDPRTKVLPKFVVGKRTLKYAKELLSKFRKVTDGTIPLFTSDKLSHYPKALLEHGTTPKLKKEFFFVPLRGSIHSLMSWHLYIIKKHPTDC